MLIRERPTQHRAPASPREGVAKRAIAASTTVLAALGGWLFWGPADGVLRFFGWEWNVGDAHTGWALIIWMVAVMLATTYVAMVTTPQSG